MRELQLNAGNKKVNDMSERDEVTIESLEILQNAIKVVEKIEHKGKYNHRSGDERRDSASITSSRHSMEENMRKGNDRRQKS